MLLVLVIAAAMGALGALPAVAKAEVRFDGKEWFLSQKSKFVRVTDEGYLEWAAPGAQQQLIVRLPEMQLGEIGDIAEVRYLYKADGPATAAGNLKQQTQAGNPHPISDTGNFRIGLFDSNGKGYIKDDGYGRENDVWNGYLGYYADVSPHVAEDAKRLTADGKLILPGKIVKRTSPDSPTLLDEAAGRQVDRGIGGFDAPLGRFVPMFLKLKRTGPNTVHVSVTVDNVTYLWIEEDASIRPGKIDVFSIGFPGQSPYTKVTLAPLSAAKSLLKKPLRPTSMKHVDVYKEPGRFGGWPAGYSANQWIWGNEIMVAFRRGYYKFSPTTHNVDWSRPSRTWQARSLDGGETWTLEQPARTSGRQDWPDPSNGGVDFTHPDFAMRVGGRFSISYDRGRTWQGHYRFTGIDLGMTSRHDYMVEDQKQCLFFLSAAQPEVSGSNHNDRAFMARTMDGGKTFEFVSWLTDEQSIRTRSVMPSAVRTSPSRLVAATRRKLRNNDTRRNSNWIEASVSTDNGASWQYLSKVSDTDRGEENGSPPAMVRLRDGRLAVAYGYRSWPLGIRARISEDDGKTWSDEIVLRDDGHIWDLGYPRMMQRPDGKLVTIYYHNTREHPEPHIVATIWDPNTVTR
ncbi:MAG TPA: sialidase family protein [Sedimentisphaerales bacterium]|nr:sialidase family protein [Sedimentisphaerales bacterium]